MAFFRYLDLPQEVRDLVYAELSSNIRMEFNQDITDDGFCSCNFSIVETIAPTTDDSAEVHPASDDSAEDSGLVEQRAAILSTSRQVRVEMLGYLSMHTSLRIDEPQRIPNPAQTLKDAIPVAVREQLTSIDFDMLGKSEFVPLHSSSYSPLAKWLRDVFPGLKHVNITDRTALLHRGGLEPAEEDATSHANMVKSYCQALHFELKTTHQCYEYKGFALSLYLTYELRSPLIGPIVSRWVRPKVN